MPEQAVEIETSLSKEAVVAELEWAIAQYNREKADDTGPIEIQEFDIVESQGVTGTEIAFFLAGAAASGLTWDIMKYLALEVVVPRINKKFGAGSAKPKR